VIRSPEDAWGDRGPLMEKVGKSQEGRTIPRDRSAVSFLIRVDPRSSAAHSRRRPSPAFAECPGWTRPGTRTPSIFVRRRVPGPSGHVPGPIFVGPAKEPCCACLHPGSVLDSASACFRRSNGTSSIEAIRANQTMATSISRPPKSLAQAMATGAMLTR